jgi:transcriptional regulator with XRE-family HTH domain
MKETLGQYIKRIMRQKKLTVRDIEKGCDNELTHSYVARIIKDKVENPTLATMVALAKGLDEDLYQVFKAASGQSPRETIDPLFLLEVIQKAFLHPELLEVIEGWDRLPKKLRETIVHAVRQSRLQAKKKPKRKR